MATKKPKFPAVRKVPEADAATFEDRHEQRARGLSPEVPRKPEVHAVDVTADSAVGNANIADAKGSESADPLGDELVDLRIPEAAGLRSPDSGASRSSDADLVRDREAGISQARKSGNAEPEPERRGRGGWTKSNPYTRKDGTVTRSTTLYLSVDLADRLRRYAFEADRKQSDVIVEAIELLLAQRPSGRR